jgi:hypothetical protein
MVCMCCVQCVMAVSRGEMLKDTLVIVQTLTEKCMHNMHNITLSCTVTEVAPARALRSTTCVTSKSTLDGMMVREAPVTMPARVHCIGSKSHAESGRCSNPTCQTSFCSQPGAMQTERGSTDPGMKHPGVWATAGMQKDSKYAMVVYDEMRRSVSPQCEH